MSMFPMNVTIPQLTLGQTGDVKTQVVLPAPPNPVSLPPATSPEEPNEQGSQSAPKPPQAETQNSETATTPPEVTPIEHSEMTLDDIHRVAGHVGKIMDQWRNIVEQGKTEIEAKEKKGIVLSQEEKDLRERLFSELKTINEATEIFRELHKTYHDFMLSDESKLTQCTEKLIYCIKAFANSETAKLVEKAEIIDSEAKSRMEGANSRREEAAIQRDKKASLKAEGITNAKPYGIIINELGFAELDTSTIRELDDTAPASAYIPHQQAETESENS